MARTKKVDPLDTEPLPPDGYQGRWYKPDELRRVNKELAKHGRRICTAHQSAALPLDDEHFYRTRGRYRNICKVCDKRAQSACHKKRYQTDAAYRQRVNDRNVEFNRVHADAHNANCRASRRRRKAQRFAVVIGKAS